MLPPSTTIACPVMKSLPEEQRNTTKYASLIIEAGNLTGIIVLALVHRLFHVTDGLTSAGRFSEPAGGSL